MRGKGSYLLVQLKLQSWSQWLLVRKIDITTHASIWRITSLNVKLLKTKIEDSIKFLIQGRPSKAKNKRTAPKGKDTSLSQDWKTACTYKKANEWKGDYQTGKLFSVHVTHNYYTKFIKYTDKMIKAMDGCMGKTLIGNSQKENTNS